MAMLRVIGILGREVAGMVQRGWRGFACKKFFSFTKKVFTGADSVMQKL